MWKYLVNYILLGASALLIVMESIESGAWRDLGVPLLLLLMAIGNLARLQAAECKQVEPAAAPDRRGM
jgi:NhaP-type Na+/H+ and K+/H+ antiporter